MKMLCTADLHLGRRPSAKVPDDLGVDPSMLGPRAAWRDFVDQAIERQVDAVLLAGDLVDEEDDLYEAFGALLEGARRLDTAGIPIIAIAGNHDARVLPRLTKAVGNVTLLGADATWERRTLTGADGVAVDVIGWSMPGRHFDASPLETYPSFDRERPTIGLLHADLDASGGRYAPVARSALRATNLDAWLLGHIHQPDPFDEPHPIGYLGPPVGTDPGEPGPRGPWLLEVDPAGALTLTLLPRAPLAWDRITLDVTDLESVDAAVDALMRALDAKHAEATSLDHPPRAFGIEAMLIGRTSFGAALREASTPDALATFRVTTGGVTTFVYRVRDALRPNLDLTWRAQQDDPVGLLAQRVLALREGGESADALVRRAKPALRKVWRGSAYTNLNGDEPSDDVVRDALERAALRAIETLLEERDGS